MISCCRSKLAQSELVAWSIKKSVDKYDIEYDEKIMKSYC